jgi:hypothetical protein
MGTSPERKDAMWMQSKNASWEAEGQVEERIGKALAEGAQWRLANVAKGNRDWHLRKRMLTTLSASLAWLATRAKAEQSLCHLPIPDPVKADQYETGCWSAGARCPSLSFTSLRPLATDTQRSAGTRRWPEGHGVRHVLGPCHSLRSPSPFMTRQRTGAAWAGSYYATEPPFVHKPSMKISPESVRMNRLE